MGNIDEGVPVPTFPVHNIIGNTFKKKFGVDLPILLIEGKGRNPHTILSVLNKSGQSIEIVKTVEEAILKVRQQDYSVVLLTLCETDVSGLTTLRQILDENWMLPVIVVSQQIHKKDLLTFLANGAYACIPRSCDRDVLAAILHRAMSYKDLARKASFLENALKDTEERLASMSNSTPDAIIHADNLGTIISVNRAARDLFLYSEKEMVGKPLTQLMPIQYRDAHQVGMARMRTTGVGKIIGKTLELRGLRKDGREFPLELSLSTWLNKERRFYSGIIRDITKGKEKEARLKTQAEQLRRQAQWLELVQVLVHNLDNEIIFWNTGAEKLYGWTKAQALGKVSHSMLQTIFPIPFEEIRKTVLEEGAWEGELIHTKQNGTQIVVASHWELQRDELGHPLAIVEVNNDITLVKRAEKCQRIQIDVNFSLSSAKNLKEAASSILQQMCEVGDWDFAYLWRCCRQRRETSKREALWINTARTTPNLCQIIDQTTVAPSSLAIPTLILETEKAVWLAAEHQELASYPVAFAESGLREVFGVPIRNQHSIYGGIVFGGQANHIPNFSCSEAFVNVGWEIGQFIDQELHNEQLSRINECLINFGKDVHANITSLVVLCGEFFDATCATYTHLEGSHLQTIHRWRTPPNALGPDPDGNALFQDIMRQEGPTLVVNRDLITSSNVPPTSWLHKHSIKTHLGQVIMVHGRRKGVLSLFFQWDVVPNDCDKQLLGILANALAVEEERGKTEQTLQRAYDDTKRLLSSVPGAVLIVNQDLLVEYANDIACKFFTQGQRRIVGKNLKAIIPIGQTRWDQLAVALSSHSEKKNTYQGPQEFELNERSYQYRGFSVNLQACDQSQNGLFIWDITREKDLQEHLMQSEKLAGLGTLVSGMAHEVNNPAQSILSMGEIILGEEDLTQIKDLAVDIIGHAKHIGAVVKNFSSYARPSFLDGIQRINVNHRLRDAVKMIQIGKHYLNIQVVYELCEVPLIFCSQVEIDQAFINLIRNAMDAMSESGILTLQTQVTDNRIVIRISDTGAGIPADLRGMIFHPFFTTKPPGKGTGLGLSIVHRIITKYRGIIEVESEEGHGTTFTITLPVEVS